MSVPYSVFVTARELIAKTNEHLFVFYELGDLEGARRCRKKIAKIKEIIDRLD
jgi:hypothetical protein